MGNFTHTRSLSALCSSFALGLSLSMFAACDAENTAPAPAPGSEAPADRPAAAGNDSGNDDGTVEDMGAVTGINPRATEFADDLTALGYDITNLPPLGQVVAELQAEPEKLGALMESFSDALGVECSGCHTAMTESGQVDFAAVTPEKNITAGMWDEFVAKLSFADGSPLYCDSCHQGQAAFLDRSNPRELGAWMRTNFVQGLARRDGEANNCATCHGAPFEGEFLEQWAAVAE